MYVGGLDKVSTVHDRALFKSYKVVYLQLKHVQGLNIGSVVSLSGINIGNIYSIEIADGNQVRLALKIDEQFLKRIHKDAEAELRTQGALGDKYPDFPGKRLRLR